MRKVDQFIEQHALIKQHSTVLVAVSGGPDSVALLHYLSYERKKRNIKVIALTVNHQLRKDAHLDVEYVIQLCHKLQVPYVTTKIDVKTFQAENKVSTQVAARKLRYQFFAEQMDKYRADYLVLGHHADDQLETMLMVFSRSASTNALLGIPYRRPFATGHIIRPFLCLTKEEIINYCKKHQLVPRLDPSNEDLSYTRNYFRKRIVPLLKEQNMNLHLTVQRLSEALLEDEKYLQDQAKKIWQKIITVDLNEHRISFNRLDLLKYSKALQRRIYHLILNYLYDELPNQLTYNHADNFFTLLTNENSHAKINFPQRLLVEKSYDQVNLYFNGQTPQDLFSPQQLIVPGKVVFPDGSILFADFVDKKDRVDEYKHIVCLGKDDLPLFVRTRKAGDRMTWEGLNGRKKIKDIFIDEKIPRDQRDQWPIVATKRDEIIWLVGLKKGKLQKDHELGNRFVKLIYKQS